MATLYELTKEGANLYSLLESGEIDEQTFRDALEAIGADEKLDTYCNIIQQFKADIAMYDAEEKRLAKKRESAEANLKRMREAVGEFLSAIGKNKLKTALWTASISPTASVNILDETAIPAEFKIPQPDKIDRMAIGKLLKAGEEVKGAVLEMSTKLTIR